ncbi:MAG TPA: hypothetical protein VE957_04640 [Terriglobales bacterium]|nr:hypothetical protein [Terriglobales bacterium]
MRTIYLPALGRHVTLAAYLQAVRMAKANPDMTFKNRLHYLVADHRRRSHGAIP